MSTLERFRVLVDDEAAEIPGNELLPERLARATARLLVEVDGAGISVVADGGLRIPLGASDADAATAERLQFTVGEGPCLHAIATGESVFAHSEQIAATWPQLYDEMTARTPYRAVLSLPLRHRYHGFGSLDLNLRDDKDLLPATWDDAYTVADEIAAVLATLPVAPDISQAVDDPTVEPAGPAWLNSPRALRRQRVWVAIGMLSVHLDVAAPDALDVLRAVAFNRDQDVDDYADDLVHRRISLPEL